MIKYELYDILVRIIAPRSYIIRFGSRISFVRRKLEEYESNIRINEVLDGSVLLAVGSSVNVFIVSVEVFGGYTHYPFLPEATGKRSYGT
jgi:hypothetical protein